MCGNRVVKDEFPDWHTLLNQPRIVDFPVVDTNGHLKVNHTVSSAKHTVDGGLSSAVPTECRLSVDGIC